MLLVLVPRQSLAQTATEKPTKATELVIWKYETLLMQGALLTPWGWNTASELFQRAVVYPEGGVIQVVSTSRDIGEDWVKGDRAQVESKWVELYGSVDAKLSYHPQNSYCSALKIYDLLALTDTRDGSQQARTAIRSAKAWEWKMAGPTERAAPIERVIFYLSQQRERTDDLTRKENATKSITSLREILKKLKRSRVASAC